MAQAEGGRRIVTDGLPHVRSVYVLADWLRAHGYNGKTEVSELALDALRYLDEKLKIANVYVEYWREYADELRAEIDRLVAEVQLRPTIHEFVLSKKQDGRDVILTQREFDNLRALLAKARVSGT